MGIYLHPRVWGLNLGAGIVQNHARALAGQTDKLPDWPNHRRDCWPLDTGLSFRFGGVLR